MQRVTVWHGFWQGQAVGAMRQERPGCSTQHRSGLRAQSDALLDGGPAR